MQKRTYWIIFLVIFAAACKKADGPLDFQQSRQTLTSDAKVSATTIQFSGYSWTVKNSGCDLFGPGPIVWNEQNVWVDSSGRLHLKLCKNPITNRWECAEVKSVQSFRYGTYEWKVEGAVNALDRNVVLGFFNYNGQDGLHEMDIEFARWGVQANLPLNYTVYPTSTGHPTYHNAYDFTMDGTYTTHRFTRTNKTVVYKSLGGFQDGDINLFRTATCAAPYTVSTLSMPIYMNLWLFQGVSPTNNTSVEIIIHSFKYTP
ncbi:MAG: hypothetical protein JWQ25_2251 [Daejeonella sp.]|nr:hypothetical protein [Daejeonella sp.]